MSKSVVLVLKSGYEQDYGEHTNTPVFNAHGETIGWTGGEVPEYGHPCEFNALGDEGFASCASSVTVNRLRDENAKLLELARWQDVLTNAVHVYWANPDSNLDDASAMLRATSKVLALKRELGIEAE